MLQPDSPDRHAMIPSPSSGDISVVARTPGLDAASIESVVTVPTFRRPRQILETLASLKAQRTSRRFAVIVMENDADHAEGAAAARGQFESGAVDGLLIIAHQRGNCSAYNAGWQTALIQFPNMKHLVIIDDDEIADPAWLETMCDFADKGFDIVGGPQVPVFADRAKQNWSRHPVFAPPYGESGQVRALFSSGNLLISRNVLAKMGPPFLDLRFNFLGGGDSDFLSRSAVAGFRLGWCAEAKVYEDVPERRTEWSWVRARSIRNGVISSIVERRKRAGQPLGRLKVVAKSLALLALGPWRGVKAWRRSGMPVAFLDPILVGAGRVLAEFGYAREQYREPEKN